MSKQLKENKWKRTPQQIINLTVQTQETCNIYQDRGLGQRLTAFLLIGSRSTPLLENIWPRKTKLIFTKLFIEYLFLENLQHNPQIMYMLILTS